MQMNIHKTLYPFYPMVQWFLTRRRTPQGGVKKFLGERKPLHALQHRKFLKGNVSLLNVIPVLILRSYVLFGVVPTEMEVVVKYIEILQAEFESACKHSGA